MTFCSKCGTDMGSDNLFCPSCGTPSQFIARSDDARSKALTPALFAGVLAWLVGYGAAGMLIVSAVAGTSEAYRFKGSLWFGVMGACLGADRCAVDIGTGASIVGWILAIIFFSIVSFIFKRNDETSAKRKCKRILEGLALAIFVLFVAYFSVTSDLGRSGGMGMFIVWVAIGISGFFVTKVLRK